MSWLQSARPDIPADKPPRIVAARLSQSEAGSPDQTTGNRWLPAVADRPQTSPRPFSFRRDLEDGFVVEEGIEVVELGPGPPVAEHGVRRDVLAEIGLEDVDPRTQERPVEVLEPGPGLGKGQVDDGHGAFHVSPGPPSRTTPSGRGASDNP